MKIGTGILVGNYPAQSKEWLELRRTGIGGSDIAAVCGLSKYQSAFTLWAIKTGAYDPGQQSSEPMEWGVRLEPVIAQKFRELHPDIELNEQAGTYCHQERDWQLANPDGILTFADGTQGILEIKTARYEDDWGYVAEGQVGTADGVPRYYQTQVQWYLQTFGFEVAIVAVLFGGSKYREYHLTADPFVQETNLAEAIKFREYVQRNQQPDWDGSQSTYETVRSMSPGIIDDQEELGDLGIHYFNKAADFAQVSAEFTELKSRVIAALEGKKRGLIEGEHRLTLSSRNGGAPFLTEKKGR